MTHVLYIEASPRKDRSASIDVARAALSALQTTDKSISVDVMDVWSTKMPEFDGPVMEAKYAGIEGRPLTAAQAAAWAEIRAIAARFLAADILVLAVPMWNFSVPYKLKQLIDVVSQKDILFTFDGRSFCGLLPGRQALLICARGLGYSPDSDTPARDFDFQIPYIEAWLRFIGIAATRTVVVEETLLGREEDLAGRERARLEAVSAVYEIRAQHG